jgi:MoxR-like ATPase
MRPIPAPRLGDSHGLLRVIDERGRVRLDEFVTDFSAGDLFPPGLENALGRTRQFVSFARAAGLLKEDRGTVELTEIGRRYIRAGDDERPFDVSPAQAEWLRRQLREKHMTDSIYHGLAIALSLLASGSGTSVSTLDFGRSLGYLGRAGWDNENTLQIQGERHVTLLRDMELIDEKRSLTPIGTQAKSELTLPVHMSLPDIAASQNPGGAEAVRQAAEAEWAAAPEPEAAPVPETAAAPEAAVGVEDEYQDVGRGAWAEPSVEPPPSPVPPPEPAPSSGPPPEPAPSSGPPPEPAPSSDPPPEPAPSSRPPVPPPDVWETAAPDDATRAYAAVPTPPEAPAEAPGRREQLGAAAEAATPATTPSGLSSGDPLEARPSQAADPADAATVISTPPADGPGAATGPRSEPAAPPHEPAAPPLEPVGAQPRSDSAEPPHETPAHEPLSAADELAAPPREPARAEPAAEAVAAPLAFVAASDLRATAAEQGLRMDVGVYANVAAALAAGRHVVLVGAPGAGKTSLALAVAKAAVQAGKADGAELVSGAGGALREQVLAAAARRRWLLIDELDRGAVADALGPLSAFLAGLPVTLPGDGGEVVAPESWRIVATADRAPEGAPAALLSRFAFVEVGEHEDLEAAIDDAAGGDRVAAAAVRRLLPVREVAPVGGGPFLVAAHHAVQRRAAAATDDTTLARELYAAYLAPLLGDREAEARARLRLD